MNINAIEIVNLCEQREMWHCIGIGVIFVLAAIVFAVVAMPRITAVIARTPKLSRALFAAFVAGLTMYGGAKHQATVSYPQTDPDTWYLHDNGSYVTNDAVHIAFNRNLLVPATANLFIDGLELCYTNAEDWATHSFNAYSNTFNNVVVPFDLAYQFASNFNWMVYTDWTPPPVVHTNGVAYVMWQQGYNQASNRLATTRTGIYVDAIRVAPNPNITNAPAILIQLTITEDDNEK